MAVLGYAAFLLLGLLYPALAQNATDSTDNVPDSTPDETIWGVITINTFGERVPLLSPDYSVITPTGANQMNDAGRGFRNRYITPTNVSIDGNRTILNISQYEIDNRQILNYGLNTIFVDQSAQAFLQGLYPPLNVSTPNNSGYSSLGRLASNRMVMGPLGGY